MIIGSADSKRPTLTNCEILTYVITIHQRHRQTDTDGRTHGQTCDRMTALCIVVHRAVKIDIMQTITDLTDLLKTLL